MILIMCYRGYRIKAYTDIEVNLTEGYFKGGVKTITSKSRTVPIHPAIYSLVEKRYNGSSNNLLISSTASFRTQMYSVLEQIGVQKHTPHDCRHNLLLICC